MLLNIFILSVTHLCQKLLFEAISVSYRRGALIETYSCLLKRVSSKFTIFTDETVQHSEICNNLVNQLYTITYALKNAQHYNAIKDGTAVLHLYQTAFSEIFWAVQVYLVCSVWDHVWRISYQMSSWSKKLYWKNLPTYQKVKYTFFIGNSVA